VKRSAGFLSAGFLRGPCRSCMVSIVSLKGGRAAAGAQVPELPCANREEMSTLRASRSFRARACPPPAMLEDSHIGHGHATRLIPGFFFLILRVGTLQFNSHHSGAAEKRTGQDIFVDWQTVDLAPCATVSWKCFIPSSSARHRSRFTGPTDCLSRISIFSPFFLKSDVSDVRFQKFNFVLAEQRHLAFTFLPFHEKSMSYSQMNRHCDYHSKMSNNYGD